jgi:hypothetical protein
VITDFDARLGGASSENWPAVGTASACAPYPEIIELCLGRDRNAMAIWQDLVSDHGLQGGYQSVRRFAYKLRGAQIPQARAVILTRAGLILFKRSDRTETLTRATDVRETPYIPYSSLAAKALLVLPICPVSTSLCQRCAIFFT